MAVAIQLFVSGLYLPPVLNPREHSIRPRRSSRCRSRLRCDGSAIGRIGRGRGYPTIGARIVCPASVQIAVSSPPQTIISLPVQTAVWDIAPRGIGGAGSCPAFVPGLYLPPVFRNGEICHPRRSFHCQSRLRCESPRHRARWLG